MCFPPSFEVGLVLSTRNVNDRVFGIQANLKLDSNGHGCMLQYALLHLFGYKLTIDDLKNFRVSPSEPYIQQPFYSF